MNISQLYSPAFTGIRGYAIKDKTKPEDKVEFDLQDSNAKMTIIKESGSDKLLIGDLTQMIPGIEDGYIYDEIKLDEVNGNSGVRLFDTDSVNVSKVADNAALKILNAKINIGQVDEGTGLILEGNSEAIVGDMRGSILNNTLSTNTVIQSDTQQKIHIKKANPGSKASSITLKPNKPINIVHENGFSIKVVGKSLNISA